MTETPLSHGWKFYKTCNCGGNYQEWFTKSGLTLKIFPKNNKFQVTERGRHKRSGQLHELTSYLTESITA